MKIPTRYVEDEIRLKLLTNVIKVENQSLSVSNRDKQKKIIVKNIYNLKCDVRSCMKNMLRNYKMCSAICCLSPSYSEN